MSNTATPPPDDSGRQATILERTQVAAPVEGRSTRLRRFREQVVLAAVCLAAALITAGCDVEGQPAAIAFEGCERAYWSFEDTCWFTRAPMGTGIEADPYRVDFLLKTVRVDGIGVNGAPAQEIGSAQIPAASNTVYALAEWPYDVDAGDGQVAHLMGRKVTLAVPSSPPPNEGSKFDVIVTYRGWALGDTSESAEVSRRFRFTRSDPHTCTARKPTITPSTGKVGTQVKITWRADNCKQAALFERPASTGGSAFPVGDPPRPTSSPAPDSVSDAYVVDAGGANLSGSAEYELTSDARRFVVHAWAFDGTFSRESSDTVQGTTPAQPPTSTPPIQEYEFCLKSSLYNIHIWVNATSEAAAKQELQSQYGGFTITSGACPLDTP